mmetsp:Transcript_91346/g.175871  ORF Transcript_91346/g.175871 Transcript_91346/m.175871 type:complete len:293 (-) Transcript_91346:50-928(-)
MKHAPGQLTGNLFIVAIFVATLCVAVSASNVGGPILTDRFIHVVAVISIIGLVIMALLLAGVCAVCCAGGRVGKVVKDIIMRLDKDAIGVDVTVGNLVVAVHTGKVEVHDVTLLNPEPYSSEYLLKAGHVKVDIDMLQLLLSRMRQITIQSLVFEDVDLIWEKNGLTHSNIKAILEFVVSKQSENGQQHQQQQQQDSVAVAAFAAAPPHFDAAPTGSFAIDELVVKDVSVKIASHMMEGAGVRLALEDFTIADVSHALTQDMTAEIAREVLHSVLKTIVVNTVGKSVGNELF